MKKLKGIHHVTAITGDAQKNLDFYVGVLGMRLVKKTVNFDDPNSYHLYFGDETGSPGTLLTFFAWPGAAKGRMGASEPVAVSFEVPKGALAWWEARLQKEGDHGRVTLFDPDGMRVELLEGRSESGSPGVRRIHAVTLHLADLPQSGALFVNGLQFAEAGANRYQVGEGPDAGYVEVKSGEGGRGRMGAGTIHHVAFRTDDDASQEDWLGHVVRLGLHVSPVMDRKYFHSIYFREPSGVLFEIATDPPGMTVDETAGQLGQKLMLPAEYEDARSELEATLPPLKTPGLELLV
jgi:glyoxalase family protein